MKLNPLTFAIVFVIALFIGLLVNVGTLTCIIIFSILGIKYLLEVLEKHSSNPSNSRKGK